MDAKVLIVEDDPAIRMLTRTVLESRGYAVAECCDGPSALPTARDFGPDVVLLDIGLPGMDGFGVLGLLKDDELLRDVPVLMVTAWAEPDLIARALDNGAHDYVRKPFDIGELAARVDAAARQKARQDQLRAAEGPPTIDTLTGVLNRVALTEDLRRQTSTARRSGRPYAVVLLDLDDFKAINDVHGVHVGDELLAMVAERLRGRVRVSDVFGRWGGEEFIVLAPETDLGGAGALAEDLRTALAEQPFGVIAGTLRVTGSFGVAVWFDEGADDVVARADAALAAAKASGRNTVRLAPDLTSPLS